MHCVASNNIDPSYSVSMMLSDALRQHYSLPSWLLPFRIDEILSASTKFLERGDFSSFSTIVGFIRKSHVCSKLASPRALRVVNFGFLSKFFLGTSHHDTQAAQEQTDMIGTLASARWAKL